MGTRVETVARVGIYEADDQETDPNSLVVEVSTHPIWEDRVRLSLRKGVWVTVVADDLRLAIDRCSEG